MPPAVKHRRGFILAYVLIMLPLCLLAAFTLSRLAVTDLQFSARGLMRSQLSYMAEAGLAMAMQSFSDYNFVGTTHQGDGVTLTTGPGALRMRAPGFVPASGTYRGWYEWSWQPGQPLARSYTRTGQPEYILVRIWYPATAAGQWRIDALASLSVDPASLPSPAGMGGPSAALAWPPQSTMHSLYGTVHSAFENAMFGASDLAEFTHFNNETVSGGDVRTNGNLYFNPVYSNVQINLSDAEQPHVIAGQKIIRYTDAWNQVDGNGEVHINTTLGNPALRGYLDGATGDKAPAGQAYLPIPGVAFDSTNPQWTSPTQGAGVLFQHTVVDKTLGAQTLQPLSFAAFQPGGYYEMNATQTINASTSQPWLQHTTIYNAAEQTYVPACQVLLDKLPLSAGGNLIYSEMPIELLNGEDLRGHPLAVVSCAPIYIKGSFNVAAAPGGQPPWAAVMTSDRVFPVSYNFKEGPGAVPPSPLPNPAMAPAVLVDPTTVAPQTAVNDMVAGGNPVRFTASIGGGSYDPAIPVWKGTIQLNCATVDGAPTVSEFNWATSDPTGGRGLPPNPMRGQTGYQQNILSMPAGDTSHIGDAFNQIFYQIFYNPTNPNSLALVYPSLQLFNSGGMCFYRTDSILELFQGAPLDYSASPPVVDMNPAYTTPMYQITMQHNGSIIHLENAHMASNFDNNNGEKLVNNQWQTAWLMRSHYLPPIRVFNYDPNLATMSNNDVSRFAPRMASRAAWVVDF
jgi:hypothetical protein